ncbi:antibiotic biosynthesis monooxygenase [Glycomyces buryatensis]|uniref:Antibiotic biosynthesis monooxygenase n=1 Tax=Glycomyces buryatensis TaxID=2570927 RepID=A0A4S8QIM8_9ACTN|nr:antibiotic biosynthesis monooxygenase [Glycomyces buryatensis]THV43611.1 antibiotic biosynthesis monooxygenase [Glycomyces buryatensis]
MLVLYRFAVTESETDDFSRDAETALTALAACDGYVRGGVGRAVDEDATWLLWTEWTGVGVYRRALGNYQVKMSTPLLSRALPEASGFEVLAECAPGDTPVRSGSDRSDDAEAARRESAR